MSELALTVSEVQSVLEELDVTKATGSYKIPAKLLKETASVIVPALVSFLKVIKHRFFPAELEGS